MRDRDSIESEVGKLEQKLEKDVSDRPEQQVQYWIHRVETLNWVLENNG